MKKDGTMAFALSLLIFAIFAANVVMGAFRAGVFLNDVGEMLMLFAAVICFVIGILGRQAADRSSRANQTAN